MRVSRAAILQQGAAFGIGRGDVRHVRWLSRARSDCYASDMRQVRRLSRAGGVVMSVTSVTPPTCATRDGSEGARRPLRVRRAPRATALESGRRGPICCIADARHARRLSRARSDCYASDARHARRLSRAGGVADVGHESMLASTISRARLQGSKSDMPTR